MLLITFKIEEDYYFEPGNMGWCWGATFFDYENDGDNDLYITNGLNKYTSLETKQKNRLYIHYENKFFHLSYPSDESQPSYSRATAALDLNNTGYSDLVVTNYADHASIFKNNYHKKNSFYFTWKNVS